MIAPSDYETRYRLCGVIHLFQCRKRGEYLFHDLQYATPYHRFRKPRFLCKLLEVGWHHLLG